MARMLLAPQLRVRFGRCVRLGWWKMVEDGGSVLIALEKEKKREDVKM